MGRGMYVLSLATDASGCNQSDGFWQCEAFFCEDAISQCFRGVFRIHMTCSLEDGWSVVVLLVNQVHGAATLRMAGCDDCAVNGLAIHALASELR